MRVTQGLLFQQAVDGVNRQNLAILREQQQISTGKRWLRPSEDPTASAQSLTATERRATLDRYSDAVAQAHDRLSSGASEIQSLSNILADAKEAATNAVNTTLTTADRNSLAQRLGSLLAQVLEVANRQDNYGPLFAGTANGTPYTQVDGKVVYLGNDGKQTVAIGDTLTLSTNISGSELFAKEARTQSAFLGGDTGAVPGTGTDSGLDRGSLVVIHGTTTYGDAALTGGTAGGDTVSGIRPASTSAAQDTIIGPAGANTITIDSINKTIRLNNGPAVAYTGSETDLAVSDGSGGTVHLNVGGITASYQGTVNIQSSGFLSTDGGTTKTPISFGNNQVVVNSADASTTNVNSKNIRRTGTETVDYKGTSDLFQSLAGLRDDLLNYDNLPAATREQSIQARSRELNRNFENALVSLADVGSRVKVAETAADRLQENRDQISNVISGLQDTDFASVVVDYNKSQIALQLAQASGSRLMQTNILAFLQ